MKKGNVQSAIPNSTTSRSQQKANNDDTLQNSNCNWTTQEIDSFVHKGESKVLLTQLAKSLVEEFNQFSNDLVTVFNSSIEENSGLIQNYIKASAEEKKKLDSMKGKGSERQAKLEMLLNIKNKFYS